MLYVVICMHTSDVSQDSVVYSILPYPRHIYYMAEGLDD